MNNGGLKNAEEDNGSLINIWTNSLSRQNWTINYLLDCSLKFHLSIVTNNLKIWYHFINKIQSNNFNLTNPFLTLRLKLCWSRKIYKRIITRRKKSRSEWERIENFFLSAFLGRNLFFFALQTQMAAHLLLISQIMQFCAVFFSRAER